MAENKKASPEAEETVSIVLPEDLSTLSNDELETLRGDAIAAFNELYQSGQADLSKDQLAVLRQLKEAKLALDGEKASRAEDAGKLAAEAAELAASFADNAEDEEEAPENPERNDEEDDEDERREEAAPEEEPAPPKQEKKETITAASPQYPRSISVPALKSRQTAKAKVSEPESPIKAALGLDSYAASATMSMEQMADAFAEITESARPGPINAARRGNSRFSQKHKVAHIEKPFDPRAVVGNDNDADSAVAFAVDEKRLKGGSLVAAGGWCAPSETLYDLCSLESRDGLLSLPEVAVRRGGIRFTQGPDWATIFANTGFCFTEADDQSGNYSLTDEVNTLTEGGAGLTSFTLTVNGQTTAAIAEPSTPATVQAALEALSNVAPGDVYVAGGGQPFTYTLYWRGALANQDVTVSATPTGGTGTVTVATPTAGGQPGGGKPCDVVECPTFTDVRLDVCGVCIQSGMLLNRAYPEAVQRYVSGALTAHMHRVATNVLTDMIAGSTAISPTQLGSENAATAPLLSAIELQAEDIKYRYRMSRGATLEAIFPFWVRGVIRADLSRRNGVELLSVTDAQIDAWFRARGINAQFIYNFDNLGTSATGALVWPTTVRFLIYPAGTWVRGSSEIITLSMLHDSTLNAQNNFTAIFTEEGWMVMKKCHVSRVVTVPLCTSGGTAAQVAYTCS